MSHCGLEANPPVHPPVSLTYPRDLTWMSDVLVRDALWLPTTLPIRLLQPSESGYDLTTRRLAAVDILAIVAKFEADRTWMRPREGLEGGLRQTEAR